MLLGHSRHVVVGFHELTEFSLGDSLVCIEVHPANNRYNFVVRSSVPIQPTKCQQVVETYGAVPRSVH